MCLPGNVCLCIRQDLIGLLFVGWLCPLPGILLRLNLESRNQKKLGLPLPTYSQAN